MLPTSQEKSHDVGLTFLLGTVLLGSVMGFVTVRLANTGFDGRWIAIGTLLVALGGLMLTWLRREPLNLEP